MLRLVVLSGLLLTAAWFAHEAGWFRIPVQLPLAASSPHESYERALVRAGVSETAMGRAWLDASRRTLESPQQVTLPSQAAFRVETSTPAAWSFRVALKRGQRVEVTAAATSVSPVQTFIDVFAPGVGPTAAPDPAPDHQLGALRALTFEADEDREVIVRVQPELLRAATLEVTLRAAPALRFPVANGRPRDLQSIFGDPRDAGRRQHEGVDIFASRGTPVVSATSGVVMRVGETSLGGRVVWVWDATRGLRLYYAHLDEQLVTTGQRVDAGDVIGTVGNTGNARTTPPHLHFGIYERGTGAIDPYWFIAPSQRGAAASR